MTSNFPSVWDSATPSDIAPQFYLGLTEQLINEYLATHRQKDASMYAITKEFQAANGAEFKLTVTVGGKGRKPKPVVIDLAPLGGAASKKVYVPAHQYPVSQAVDRAQDTRTASPDKLALIAQDCLFEFSWRRVGGVTWKHDLPNVNFRIDAEALLSESDGTHALNFRATSVGISQDDLDKINDATNKIGSGTDDESDQKIADLFMALLQVASTELATRLAASMDIPAFKVGDFDVYIHLFRVMENMVVVGADVDAAQVAGKAAATFASHSRRLNAAFASDILEAGGTLAVLYGPRKAEQIARAKPLVALAMMKKFAKAKPHLAFERLPRTKAVLQQMRAPALAPGRRHVAASRARAFKANKSIAVAISEYCLDTLIERVGNSSAKECTKTLPAGLIKGRLCYEFYARNPDISITNTGLTGAVDIYAFAGLEYWLKKVWDCSWRWDGPHKKGIGIKGRPKLSIATKEAADGLRIKADFSLAGVKLFTGDALTDELLKLLSPLFMRILEAFLDAIAGLLTFVVLPVQLAIDGQTTKLKLSGFKSARYVRTATGTPPPLSSQLTFLIITADGAAV